VNFCSLRCPAHRPARRPEIPLARRTRRWVAFLAELSALLLAGYVGFETHYANSERG